MFCKMCGQPTTNKNAVCDSCRDKIVEERMKNKIAKESFANPKFTSTYGLSQGIWSIVLATVGIIFAIIAMTVEAIAIGQSKSNPSLGGYIALIIMTHGFIIASMILGFSAISKFKEATANNATKPVGSLVTGIIGASSNLATFIIILSTYLLLGAA